MIASSDNLNAEKCPVKAKLYFTVPPPGAEKKSYHTYQSSGRYF